MTRATILMGLIAAASLAAGCGRHEQQQTPKLTFEMQRDTAGLSQGKPLLERIEPFRASNGALRVRGDVGFPDGVRIQISLYRKGTNQMLSCVQVSVDHRHFETPPILGASGPLPHGAYRFEYMSLFNEAWQTPDVLRGTDAGRSLRGPGMTRDRVGGAAFYLVEERTL